MNVRYIYATVWRVAPLMQTEQLEQAVTAHVTYTLFSPRCQTPCPHSYNMYVTSHPRTRRNKCPKQWVPRDSEPALNSLSMPNGCMYEDPGTEGVDTHFQTNPLSPN